MEEINLYFENNKNEILNFINNEKCVFPKLFLLKIKDLLDENFYYNLKNQNNVFNYFFSIKNLQIFNILYINEDYYFKSDQEYQSIYLFFSKGHKIYLNDKIKTNVFNVNSKDEICVKKGNFLKINYINKNQYDYNDILISYKEKNLFDDYKIKKINLKEVFLKHL
jgi:hypothetical protein